MWNCNRVLLQNLSECYCCGNELDGCKEAMSSEGIRSFRSKQKVSSIEDKSQLDRRVNDDKNYSFSSV